MSNQYRCCGWRSILADSSHGFLPGAQFVPPIISTASMIVNPTRVFFFYQFIDWQVIANGILLGSGSVLGVYIARKHLLNIHLESFRNYALAIFAISGVLILFKAF